MVHINDTSIWENDDNRIFKYGDVKKYFDGVSLEDVFAAYNDVNVSEFNGLTLLTVSSKYGENDRVFLTPNNEAFVLLVNKLVTEYDDFGGIRAVVDLEARPDLFEWVVCAAYKDDDYLDTLFPVNIWKPRWSGTDVDRSEPIRFPLATDFYEKHGYWVEGDGKYTDGYEYLQLQAELTVDDRLVYVFMSDRGNGFVWFADGPLPEGVRAAPLDETQPQTWLGFLNEFEDDDTKYTSKFYVPDVSIPKTILTCQDTFIFPEGFEPVVHFPVNIRRFDELNEGDLGSVIVFWDGADKFICDYTQT
jgi:hypothetical protein